MMKKHSFLCRIAAILLVFLSIPFAAGATETDEEACRVYDDFCYAVERVSTDGLVLKEDHYFEIGEKVPEDLAYYYGPYRQIISEHRYPEYSSTEYPGLLYYVPYQIVAQLLEEDFVNCGDLKSFLIERGEYDPATDTVKVGEELFDPAGWSVPVATYSDGEYTYVDGMILVEFAEWAETTYGTYQYRGQDFFIAQKNQLVLKKVGDSYKVVAFRQRDVPSPQKTWDYRLVTVCCLLAGSAVCLAILLFILAKLIFISAWKKRRG